MRKLFFLLTLLSFTGLARAQDAQATQVIIMRHAEKEMVSSNDPDLSAAGRARAAQLVQLLQDIRPDGLYATPYRRTEQTLEPLATARQMKVQHYDPGSLPAFADLLRAQEGKTIVVAGHANTAPALVNLLLKEDRYAPLSETDFGRVWIVTLSHGKALACITLNTN